MENIIEKSVVKTKQPRDKIISYLSVIICVLLSAVPLFIPLISGFTPVFVLLFGFIAYKLVTSRNIEFEYELVENFMTISKILNKRSRRKIFSGALTDFDIIAPKKSKFYEEYGLNVQTTLEAVSDLENESIYFGVIQFNSKKTCVFFETDERMLKHFKKYADYKYKS
ncbi:MAG: hypothetical protein JXQ23_00600 [Clostridia bacterium]|nr:hypothetical protein [Clostridia bacterium]